MKKLLFLLLISLNTFAQRNLNLGVGEHKTIEGGVYNITLNKDASLLIKGYTSIQNINNFHNGASVTIDKDAVVDVSGSTNLNGGGLLFVFGKMSSASMELQNGMNSVSVQGELNIFGDLQINDNSSELGICGVVNVSNYTNLHSQIRKGAVNLCNCGKLVTHGLNNNKESSVTGTGSVYYITGNINKQISDSWRVFINKECNNEALPVEIVEASFYIEENTNKVAYQLELTQESTPDKFTIEVSDDGVNWKSVQSVNIKQGGKFKGYVPNN